MALRRAAGPAPRLRHRHGAQRASTSRSARASSSRCSARPAAARRPRCASSPGFDRPDAGRIVVDGKDITGMPPNKRDMGMVFQAYSLFPNMTARAERRVRPQDPQAARRATARAACGELLELVGLGRRRRAATRTSSRAACSSASRSPGRSRSSRACCCSTSRSRRSTRRCGCSCARRSAASSSSSGSRRSTSRTTRRRRSSISDRVAVMYGGMIEQMGTPAEMYSSAGDAVRGGVHRHDEPPRGDGRRLRQRRDRPRRARACGSTRRAAGRNGERVLLLVRPETLEVEARTNGGGPNAFARRGDLQQTFLGSVTRVQGRRRRARP